MASIGEIKNIAQILRRDSLQMTTAAGSGHPTSCLSCAEIISTLFFYEMEYDVKNADNPDNDQFILSKGHAAAIYYAALKRAGCIDEDLMKYRKLHSPLEGHPVPTASPWVKVASGSLGIGLSIGVGIALGQKMRESRAKTYVLLGDSEMAEGSIIESVEIAAHYKLKNLCAIVDVNRLGQRGETLFGHNLEEYKKRFSPWGWHVEVVDGHSVPDLLNAFERARHSDKPIIIFAKTMKGRGVSFLENQEGWHGRALTKDELTKALEEIPEHPLPRIKILAPYLSANPVGNLLKVPPIGQLGEAMIATREAYGKTLALLAKENKQIVAIDAEVSNSTFSGEVKKVAPGQFVEAYIAEQNMIGMALGLSLTGHKVFASSFASFLSRAHDQLRMAALSRGSFVVCGSHAGVSIGADGASQMGLEDIGMFRSLPGSLVFYPSDAVSTENIVQIAARHRGITYIRTSRPKTRILYKPDEKFEIGDFKVLKQSDRDKAVVVGAGVTVYEALKAYEQLQEKKTNVAVIDLYCIKPFDGKKFVDFVVKHGKKVIIAEDHFPEGGIGEMLFGVLNGSGVKIEHLAVREIPHSGTEEELLSKYEIDSEAILKAVKKII